MCDPVSIGLMIAGTMMQASAQKKASSQAEAESNKQAEQADAVASRNSEIQRRRSRLLISKQRASFLKGGVQLTGTPEEVLSQTAANEELNALAILSTGQMDADIARRNAAYRRAEGRAAMTAGIVKSAGIVASKV